MFIYYYKNLTTIVLSFFLCYNAHVKAIEEYLQPALEKLQASYPDHIKNVCASYILWTDGTQMFLGDFNPVKTTAEKLSDPSLADQLMQPFYVAGKPMQNPQNDPGRIRHEPFFLKMYGNCLDKVESNLVPIVWMPNIFGQNAHILRVTKINNIHEKIQKISEELEELVSNHPEYIKFLNKPGGTFCWRNIANTKRLSAHSFGMTIDINASLSHYWQWDLKNENRTIDEETELSYRNSIPWEIVEIFEKHGFIWGGKWYHYDTMHFEYRPELIVSDQIQ